MALITTMFPHLSHLRTSAAFLSALTVIIYVVFLIVSSVLTGGNTKLAADLQATYGDVNAVDMYVKFFIETCTKNFAIRHHQYRSRSSLFLAMSAVQSSL